MVGTQSAPMQNHKIIIPQNIFVLPGSTQHHNLHHAVLRISCKFFSVKPPCTNAKALHVKMFW